MNMHTSIQTDTERILAEILDYPDLVQAALNGDTSAQHYLEQERERLMKEGNENAARILTTILEKNDTRKI